MIRPILTAAALCAAVHATATQARDTRVASRLYSQDEVVRIPGKAGVQATIAFAEDEHIENVAIGDSNSWLVTPNKRANLLFIKPLEPRARTNMTVVTDRHTYLFDLVASLAGTPLYVLRFTYPDPPKKATEQPATGGTNADEQLALSQPPVDPSQLNFAWQPRGSSQLLPARIYDDGQATYVSWAAGTPVPAILVRDERGSEGPVNFAVRGDVIIIDGVPGLIVLRSGRHSATLENKGVRPASARPPAPAPDAQPASHASAHPASAPAQPQEH